MSEPTEKSLPYPIGLMAIIEELNLQILLPAVRSGWRERQTKQEFQ